GTKGSTTGQHAERPTRASENWEPWAPPSWSCAPLGTSFPLSLRRDTAHFLAERVQERLNVRRVIVDCRGDANGAGAHRRIDLGIEQPLHDHLGRTTGVAKRQDTRPLLMATRAQYLATALV